MGKPARLIWSLIGAVVTIITLPTINEGIAGWADWLEWLGEDTVRWILAFLALGVILWVNLKPSPKTEVPSPKTEVPPGQEKVQRTPSEHQVVPEGPTLPEQARSELEIPRPGWKAWVRWTQGLPDVWLGVESTGEVLRGFECIVTDVKRSKRYEMTSGPYPPFDTSKPLVNEHRVFFPQGFFSTPTALDPGEYHVRWRAEAGVAMVFLASANFTVEPDGSVTFDPYTEEGRDNWNMAIELLPKEADNGPGIILTAESSDEERVAQVSCEVTLPDGRSTGKHFLGEAIIPRHKQEPSDSHTFAYPQFFGEEWPWPPLQGRHPVRWEYEGEVSTILLKQTCFRVEADKVKNWAGEKAKGVLDFD